MKAHKKGFAFIEFFVVITIITILVSIVVPVVKKVFGGDSGSYSTSYNPDPVEVESYNGSSGNIGVSGTVKVVRNCGCSNCTCNNNCNCKGNDTK